LQQQQRFTSRHAGASQATGYGAKNHLLEKAKNPAEAGFFIS